MVLLILPPHREPVDLKCYSRPDSISGSQSVAGSTPDGDGLLRKLNDGLLPDVEAAEAAERAHARVWVTKIMIVARSSSGKSCLSSWPVKASIFGTGGEPAKRWSHGQRGDHNEVASPASYAFAWAMRALFTRIEPHWS